MSTTDVVPANNFRGADIMERVIAVGDLSKLSPAERVLYYNRTCESLGLNPLTRPFEYLTLNGKLTLYARKDATDQLRTLRRVSLTIVDRQRLEDIYAVTARASLPDGRTDESIGAVSIGGLKGDALANALMKCETKAKRRVTLSICGLGMLDETEIETIPAPSAPSEPAGANASRTAQGLARTLAAPLSEEPLVSAETVAAIKKAGRNVRDYGGDPTAIVQDLCPSGKLDTLTQDRAHLLLTALESEYQRLVAEVTSSVTDAELTDEEPQAAEDPMGPAPEPPTALLSEASAAPTADPKRFRR